MERQWDGAKAHSLWVAFGYAWSPWQWDVPGVASWHQGSKSPWGQSLSSTSTATTGDASAPLPGPVLTGSWVGAPGSPGGA